MVNVPKQWLILVLDYGKLKAPNPKHKAQVTFLLSGYLVILSGSAFLKACPAGAPRNLDEVMRGAAHQQKFRK